MLDPVFAGAAALLVMMLLVVPLLAVALDRRRWIRNWLIGFPYLSLLPIALAIIALGMDVRIFSDGVTVEAFASAIAAVIAWFAIPIGMAAYLNRRWH